MQGTGMNGRITAGDVEKKAGVPSSAPAPAAAAAAPRLPPPRLPPPWLLPPRSPAAAGTAVPLSGMQKAGQEHDALASGSRLPPHCHADVHRRARRSLQEGQAEGRDHDRTLAKAVGVALAQHPIMFATLSPAGDAIIYNEKVNIAVAVALEQGLITPVLQDTAGTGRVPDWSQVEGPGEEGSRCGPRPRGLRRR